MDALDQAMRKAGKMREASDQLEQLQARASELRIKSGDLEVQRDQIRRQRRKDRRDARPLEGEQRPIRQAAQSDAGRQRRLDQGEVLLLARGVHHQEQPVAEVGHHEVVEDAARHRGEQGVALPAGLEPAHVGRGQRLQRRRRALAAQLRLAHVRHVEQRGAGAAGEVFGQNAGGVVDGHGVAREGHHAAAEPAVQPGERGFEERFVRSGHVSSCRAKRRSDRGPPLSENLRDSAALPRRAFLRRCRRLPAPGFPEAPPPRGSCA